MSDVISRFDQQHGAFSVSDLGYVGLPLVVIFSEAGCGVIGFDNNSAEVEAVAASRSYTRRLPPPVTPISEKCTRLSRLQRRLD